MSKEAKRFYAKSKRFLENPKSKKKWQPIAGLLIISLFIGAQITYGEFLRQTGVEGWGYGYGYGYGLGYGFDAGTLYGYRQDTDNGAYDTYAYGYGWGYRGSATTTTVGSVSYQDVPVANLASSVPTLFTITGAVTSATRITAADNVNINTTNANGTVRVLIPSGTQITKSDGTAFDASALTSSDKISSITATTLDSNASVKGGIEFGVSGITLRFNAPVTVQIPVSTSLNGQTLDIRRSADSGTTWTTAGLTTASTDTCSAGVGSNPATTATVSSGYITVYTCQASYFATYSIASNSGTYYYPGGGSSSGTPSPIVTETTTTVATTTKATTTKTTTSAKASKEKLNSLIATLKTLLMQMKKAGMKLPAGSEKYLETGIVKASSIIKDLKQGSVNVDVKTLQQFLNSQGFTVANSGAGSTGNETTYFGPATKKALSKYQASVGIQPASGYFGKLTRAYMKSAGF